MSDNAIRDLGGNVSGYVVIGVIGKASRRCDLTVDHRSTQSNCFSTPSPGKP
jgi:hypothetical protein